MDNALDFSVGNFFTNGYGEHAHLLALRDEDVPDLNVWNFLVDDVGEHSWHGGDVHGMSTKK